MLMNVDYEISWTHDATFWSALRLPVTFIYIVTWNPTEVHVNILLAPHARLCQQTVEEAYCLQFWRFGRLRRPSFLARGNIQAITTVCTIAWEHQSKSQTNLPASSNLHSASKAYSLVWHDVFKTIQLESIVRLKQLIQDWIWKLGSEPITSLKHTETTCLRPGSFATKLPNNSWLVTIDPLYDCCPPKWTVCKNRTCYWMLPALQMVLPTFAMSYAGVSYFFQTLTTFMEGGLSKWMCLGVWFNPLNEITRLTWPSKEA